MTGASHATLPTDAAGPTVPTSSAAPGTARAVPGRTAAYSTSHSAVTGGGSSSSSVTVDAFARVGGGPAMLWQSAAEAAVAGDAASLARPQQQQLAGSAGSTGGSSRTSGAAVTATIADDSRTAASSTACGTSQTRADASGSGTTTNSSSSGYADDPSWPQVIAAGLRLKAGHSKASEKPRLRNCFSAALPVFADSRHTCSLRASHRVVDGTGSRAQAATVHDSPAERSSSNTAAISAVQPVAADTRAGGFAAYRLVGRSVKHGCMCCTVTGSRCINDPNFCTS